MLFKFFKLAMKTKKIYELNNDESRLKSRQVNYQKTKEI